MDATEQAISGMIPAILSALRRGSDVEIQTTKTGVRLVEKRCRVLSKVESEKQ